MDSVNLYDFYNAVDAHFLNSSNPIKENDLRLVLEDIQPYHESEKAIDLETIDNSSGAAIFLLTASILASGGIKLIKIISHQSAPYLFSLWNAFVSKTTEQNQIPALLNHCNVAFVSANTLMPAFYAESYQHFHEPLSDASIHKLLISILGRARAGGVKNLIVSFSIGKTHKLKSSASVSAIMSKLRRVAHTLGIQIALDITESIDFLGSGIGTRYEALDILAVLEQSENRPKALEKTAIKLAGSFLTHGQDEAKRLLQSGKALTQFRTILTTHGGSIDQVKKEQSQVFHKTLYSSKSGKIVFVHTHNLGIIARILGVPETHVAGISFLKRLNSTIKLNDPLLLLESDSEILIKEAFDTIANLPIYEIQE